jgi:two-component system NarL family sensor kinase
MSIRIRDRLSRWRLVGRFALASLVAFVAIGVALSVVLSRQAVDQQEEAARSHAEFVSNSIVRYQLTARDLDFLAPMKGLRYLEFSEFVRDRILKYPVLRVKIWRSDGTVVFSDEPRLVGRLFPLAEPLYEAFHDGVAVTEIGPPSEAENLYDRSLARKVLETYVPVFLDPNRPSGSPVAVVETYTDYAVVQAQVDRAFRSVLFTLLPGLLGLYVVLLPIMRRVARRLEDQASRLGVLLERERATQTERRKLLDRTLRAGEEERTRLAAELHDGPVQRVARIGYGLERVLGRQRKGNHGEAQELLATMQQDVFDEVQQLRTMMSNLRPPVLDERGLVDALRDKAEAIKHETGLDCSVRATLSGRLDPATEIVLYRVSQEALTNVQKHARASQAWLSLSRSNGSVVLEVRDDGIGFEPSRASTNGGDHFGLMAMRERVEMAGGRWEIESGPGTGTRVRAVLPCQEAQQ